MKFHTTTLLISACILSISCQQKPASIATNDTKVIVTTAKVVQTDTIQTIKKVEANKIVGTYYVDNFYRYLKNGFELKNKKPTDSFILYTLNFKEDGRIIFKDLTKFYGCGNGVMSIQKGFWEAKANDIYKLTFDGKYAFEAKFHTESEYKFIKQKNGNIRLKLYKVIANKTDRNW